MVRDKHNPERFEEKRTELFSKIEVDDKLLPKDNEYLTNILVRLDEKVKFTLEKQDELSKRFEKLIDHYNSLLDRVVTVETEDITSIKKNIERIITRMALIEKSFDFHEKKTQSSDAMKVLEKENKDLNVYKKNVQEQVSSIVGATLEIAKGILLVYIAYKLGLN